MFFTILGQLYFLLDQALWYRIIDAIQIMRCYGRSCGL